MNQPLRQDTIIPSELMRHFKKTNSALHSLVGNSKFAKNLVSSVQSTAREKDPILIIGPKGAGKNHTARAIHLNSPNWWKEFVSLDLSDLEVDEARRKLFGYIEDRFFTASKETEGLLAKGDGSTICFNNFCSYHPSLQSAIITAVINQSYLPEGAKKRKKIKSRYIFSVLKEEWMKDHQDKFIDQLSRNRIEIPPLQERREDIVPLANHFVKRCCSDLDIAEKSLSKETGKWLKKAPWNYNVTQLKVSVYFACINSGGNELYPDNFALAHDYNIEKYMKNQLDELSIQSIIEMKLESFMKRLGKFEAAHLYDAIMERVEEPLIRLVIKHTKGNQIKASRILGINRNTLRSKLSKYKIKPKKHRSMR